MIWLYPYEDLQVVDPPSPVRAKRRVKRTPTGPPLRRGHYDAMHVESRDTSSHEAPKPNGWKAIHEGGGCVDMERLSDIDRERAELVLMAMEDAGGALSQVQVSDALSELIGPLKPTTAQRLTSRAIEVLYKQDRVLYTGLKGESLNGQLRSPIWKIKREEQ